MSSPCKNPTTGTFISSRSERARPAWSAVESHTESGGLPSNAVFSHATSSRNSPAWFPISPRSMDSVISATSGPPVFAAARPASIFKIHRALSSRSIQRGIFRSSGNFSRRYVLTPPKKIGAPGLAASSSSVSGRYIGSSSARWPCRSSSFASALSRMHTPQW